ncbi:BA14K family protein [Prosthecomicrobium pneumaticum]|uniref:Lectin-like protein BA14k n=1 Tax=Prosthecomicrobium pneumaticum TaxID=81895 RepID=A0A7W9FLS9_9HYPH|nr:BA14K family protein [Prosthecomicrobium pneumaticum]MBB5752999.1 hypothetical protein [Prosthecomicrobium pneumaticum]
MNRLSRALCALTLCATTAGGAAAAPLAAPTTAQATAPTAQSDVTEVRHRRWHHRRHHWQGFRVAPGYYYHRPYYRPYYRAPAWRLPARHVRWCEARYRSYRAWDNTFQPYNGPRRQCRSPFY